MRSKNILDQVFANNRPIPDPPPIPDTIDRDDFAVSHIRNLRKQVEELKKENESLKAGGLDRGRVLSALETIFHEDADLRLTKLKKRLGL